MVTLSQLFAHKSTSMPRVIINTPSAVNTPAVTDVLPKSILLPRRGHGHHPHPHDLQLVTHPDIFDWTSVGHGERRASLTPRTHAGAKRLAVTIGTDTVGTLESLPAALLYDWVEKLNTRGYDIQVDIYTPGNSTKPQLLTKSATSTAIYLHTILDPWFSGDSAPLD